MWRGSGDVETGFTWCPREVDARTSVERRSSPHWRSGLGFGGGRFESEQARSRVVHRGVTRGRGILQRVYAAGDGVSQGRITVAVEGVGSAADIHPRNNHRSPVHPGRANCCSVPDSRGGGRRRRRSSLHPAARQHTDAALPLGHPGPPRSLANQFYLSPVLGNRKARSGQRAFPRPERILSRGGGGTCWGGARQGGRVRGPTVR